MLYDEIGRFMSRGIFWELSTPARRKEYPPVYTIKIHDHNGLPSAYRIYMESIDEYDAAIKLVGNMKAWRMLAESNWFLDGDDKYGHEGLRQWRKDMEYRDKSAAKAQLKLKAEEGNVAAMTRLYNMSPKKTDGRKRVKQQIDDTPNIIDIAARMKGK